MRILKRRVAPVILAVGCSISGVGAACDVTGWPSTTHHPSPAKAVAAAELSARWTAGPDGIGESARAVIRSSLPSVTVWGEADRLAIAASPSVTDWAGIRAVVAAAAPAARFDGITVRIALPRRGAPPDAERALAAMPGLTLVRISMDRDAVVLVLPPDLPYPAAAVWRARRYLAASPTG